jgi:methylenetetrahydrofolate reductase (NADPH)
VAEPSPGSQPPDGPPSRLARRIGERKFVVTTEVTPPLSAERGLLLDAVRPLKGVADAVNVTDGANARAHMSALAAASLMVEAGIEPIFQLTCRDRNRIALQGDLLGAACLGIRNILALAGDDPKAGDQPEAKPVYDLSSRDLIATAALMRDRGVLPSGRPIAGAVPLFIGAADAPIDPPQDWRPTALAAKRAAGAQFVQTQFCMDLGILRRYMARLADEGVVPGLAILVGIAPLASAGAARWMRTHLFGTIIADDIVARLGQARDPRAEGVRICVELLGELQDIAGVAGAHIMAPRNAAVIPEVIAGAGLLAGDD